MLFKLMKNNLVESYPTLGHQKVPKLQPSFLGTFHGLFVSSEIEANFKVKVFHRPCDLSLPILITVSIERLEEKTVKMHISLYSLGSLAEITNSNSNDGAQCTRGSIAAVGVHGDSINGIAVAKCAPISLDLFVVAIAVESRFVSLSCENAVP